MNIDLADQIYSGALLANKAFFNSALVFPLVPTNNVEDDVNNIFTFTPTDGYTYSQHEYRYKLNSNFVSWVTCASASIQMPNINIIAGGIEVRLIGKIKVLKSTNAYIENPANITYIEITGNDSTGTINDITKPYLTINAALIGLGTLPRKKVIIGVGNFNAPTTSNIKDDTIFQGNTRPVVDSVTNPTKLINGTVINGNFKSANNNITIRNLGVDVGSYWVSLGNSATDGLTLVGIDNGTVYTAFTNNMIASNVTCLNSSPTALFHAILLQHTINPIMENVKCYYGVHGIVFKTKNGTGINLESYGNGYDGIIIKSDDYNTDTSYIQINGFKYRNINGSNPSSGNIFIESQYLGQGLSIHDVSLTNCDLDPSSLFYTLTGSVSNIIIKDLARVDISSTDSLMRGIRNHFKMDETSGNRVDVITSAVLIDNNGVGSATGIKNNSAYFTASNKSLSSVALGSLDSEFSQGTLNFWINFDVLTNGVNFLNRSFGTYEYAFYYNGGQINCAISANGTTFSYFLNGGPTLSIGNWYMISLTNDSKMYVNGSLALDAGAIISKSSSNKLVLGADFIGKIDELTFWNRRLSASDLLSLYNSGAGKSYPF